MRTTEQILKSLINSYNNNEIPNYIDLRDLEIKEKTRQVVTEIVKRDVFDIDKLLDSDFFKEEILDIEKENKHLKELGWNRNEINEIADLIIKNKTR
jgi:hypothetical protein